MGDQGVKNKINIISSAPFWSVSGSLFQQVPAALQNDLVPECVFVFLFCILTESRDAQSALGRGVERTRQMPLQYPEERRQKHKQHHMPQETEQHWT